MSDQPHVVNPESIGDPNQVPILHHSIAGCPAHSDDWLYKAVRNNRRASGELPQACTCGIGCCSSRQGTGISGDVETNGRCWDCRGTGHPHVGTCHD